jgi:CRISPR-associated protein Cmr5
MDKRKIDNLIPRAYEVLDTEGIVIGKELNNAWRGQIASFGAAISMGSLIAAVSVFSKQAQSDVDRSKLMQAIYRLLPDTKDDTVNEDALFIHVRDNMNKEEQIKEEILNATIALKLAMNLYKVTERGKGK